MWVRVVATGVVQADDEEVLLEAELMPEVSGEDWEADSQNCGGGGHQQKPDPVGHPGWQPLEGSQKPCLWMWAGNAGARREDGERQGVTFFSWPSGDSGTKLMLISSTSELEEPAECTLSASVMSPLLR